MTRYFTKDKNTTTSVETPSTLRQPLQATVTSTSSGTIATSRTLQKRGEILLTENAATTATYVNEVFEQRAKDYKKGDTKVTIRRYGTK